VQALERIGGDEARALLWRLADAEPEGLAACEARRALERLSSR